MHHLTFSVRDLLMSSSCSTKPFPNFLPSDIFLSTWGKNDTVISEVISIKPTIIKEMGDQQELKWPLIQTSFLIFSASQLQLAYIHKTFAHTEIEMVKLITTK